MKLEDVERELTKHFLSQWRDPKGKLLTKVVVENEEVKDGEEDKPWVRFSVDIFSFSPDSMGAKGNRRVLRRGTLSIQIFVPLNHKTKELNTLRTKAIRIYEGEEFNGVNFRNPRTNTMLEESDSVWYGEIVQIPFEFIEII